MNVEPSSSHVLANARRFRPFNSGGGSWLRRVCSVGLCASVVLGVSISPAGAQEPVSTTAPFLPLTVPEGQSLPADPALDTDGCPFRLGPPPAVDTSEVVPSGQPTPTLMPVPSRAAGGNKLASCGVVSPTGFSVPQRLSAGSWLVFDVDSGEVIAAKDPHGRYRPASIFKVLLALDVIKNLPLDKKLKGSAAAANIDGSKAGVGPDGTYSVEQLLLGLLLRSGNDCAQVLADALGGRDVVLPQLQDMADSMGATDTRVTSFSGLDAPGFQTSAYDLALFYRAAFNNPTFTRLVGTKMTDFPGFGDRPGFKISNDNELLFNYPGAIGGKTGFTDDARHTYAGAAQRNGRRLGVIELNATNAAGAGWEQATRLLDASWDVHSGVGALLGSPAAQKMGSAVNAPADFKTENAQSASGAKSASSAAGSSESASKASSGRRWSPALITSLALIGVGALCAVAAAAVWVRQRRKR